MYWLGLQEDDVHLNISSSGWAKHSWRCGARAALARRSTRPAQLPLPVLAALNALARSNVFAPLNAGCTIFISNQAGGRFDAAGMLRLLTQFPVTSLCAAPTAWRMLILEPLESYRVRGRSAPLWRRAAGRSDRAPTQLPRARETPPDLPAVYLQRGRAAEPRGAPARPRRLGADLARGLRYARSTRRRWARAQASRSCVPHTARPGRNQAKRRPRR